MATLWAIGNDWGNPSGPTIATNFNGTGGAIIGAGMDNVVYAPYRSGSVTTISSVAVCTGTTTVDIPVTVANFNSVGSFSLTFGFTPVQLANPVMVDINPAFTGWVFTTDPLLIASGIYKVSALETIPTSGVTISDGSTLFTLRFAILGNAMASVSFIEDIPGTSCEYAGVAPGHPFIATPENKWQFHLLQPCKRPSLQRG